MTQGAPIMQTAPIRSPIQWSSSARAARRTACANLPPRPADSPLARAGWPLPSEAPTTGWRDGMSDLEERLAALETEHRALSGRFEMMQGFFMAAISLLTEDEECETLRESIERSVVVARKSMQLDRLNDLQDLLRAFNAAMPKLGN